MLADFRLRSFDEILTLRERIGAEKFDRYQERVYNILRALTPGDTYNIIERVTELPNRDVFVKLCCLYIQETHWHCNIQLSSDYTTIRGVRPLSDIRVLRPAQKMELLIDRS